MRTSCNGIHQVRAAAVVPAPVTANVPEKLALVPVTVEPLNAPEYVPPLSVSCDSTSFHTVWVTT